MKNLVRLFIFIIISTISSLSFSQVSEEVADSTFQYIIKSIEISGNKVTRDVTILREIEFSEGDTIQSSHIEVVLKQAKNNLLNISLFHFVNIHFKDVAELNTKDQHKHINVFIEVSERWYTWPVPFAYLEERNFNDWLKHKDLSRLSYGAIIVRENFRGRREQISFGFKTGFNQMLTLRYTNPAIDKKQSLGMGFTFSFSRDHNIFYRTDDNQMQILKMEDDYAISNGYLHLSFTKRYGVHQMFRVYGQYNMYSFSDTLFSIQPQFIDPESRDLQYLTISALYKFDFRDYIHYPLEGFFFDCEINKSGFDIFTDQKFSILNIKSSYRKYVKLKEKLYFAGGVTGRLRIDNNNSYYFGRGLGFGNDYVRGYENYVIDGTNYIIIKSNIKYNIIQPRIIKLHFIPSEKFNTIPYRFYMNFFADAGYIKDEVNRYTNPLGNTMLFGYGMGIDFVTYYDRAYRVEISRNLKKEFSFAIQFTAPI
jgi:outer membrane protein assembly factor BamA